MNDVISSLFLLFLTFTIGIIVLIIVHELGHLILGFLSGYSFLLFRIWKLAVVRIDSKCKIFIVKKPDSFAQCIMYPKEMKQNPIMMMYGGIIFNLFCGLLFLIISIFLSNYIFQFMLAIVGTLNIICALLNYASRYMTDDGQSIRDMKHPKDITCYNCQLIIARHLVNGDSYKDMDNKIFMIENLQHDSSVYEKEMYFYGYYRLLELGCFKQAKERLHKLVDSNIAGWLAIEVCREMIFFYNMSKALSENSMNEYIAEMPYMQDFQQNKSGSYFRTEPKNRSAKIKKASITPYDVRINHFGVEQLRKFNRYIYPGEVKSTSIILEEIGRKYLAGEIKILENGINSL